MPKTKSLRELPLKANRPLYEVVREKIKTHISRMSVGDRLSSERELSEYFEVDRITIRRAMLDLENEGFVIRHQGRGTFIKRLAAQEKQHITGSRAIGLVLPDVEIPQNTALLRGIEEEATNRGYQIWIRNALFDAGRELEILESIGKEELAGIITCPLFGNALNPQYAELINRLLEEGIKVVLLDQYVPGVQAQVSMVDKVRVGYIAAEHLIMLGHRRICYVSTNTFDTSGNDSFRGYREALEDYGVKFDPQLEINIPCESAAKPAHKTIFKLLKDNPTICSAIATPQFAMAYGIHKALHELGVTPGKDISLVGNNMADNPEYAHITHTFQSFQEVGKAAVKLLFQEENEKGRFQKHALVQPKMVIGTT
jgi:GntR family transcriptional regulator, arabinose operon transcriptional repressor